jgi:16S rRNA (cytosine1402-N4)-methyltransferase
MHDPVLVDEVIEQLRVRDGGTYIDGTAGSGGYTVRILDAAGPSSNVLAMDRDTQAVERTRKRLASCPGNHKIVKGNFADMQTIAQQEGMQQVDGVVLDLGVSSDQLDTAERGFSFMKEGPLDMRMDRDASLTAADLVNEMDEQDLAATLRTYGEERQAGRIARAIVKKRNVERIVTTTQLASAVEGAVGGRHGRLHPATRVFQALRIAVNRELEALEQGLDAALGLLVPGGRMAVVSFHSLEDRLVKRFFRAHEPRAVALQQGGEEQVGEQPYVRVLTRRPICAGNAEQERNARSRSAKLRAAERCKDIS